MKKAGMMFFFSTYPYTVIKGFLGIVSGGQADFVLSVDGIIAEHLLYSDRQGIECFQDKIMRYVIWA